MKHIHKIGSLVIATLLILTLFPIPAHAWTGGLGIEGSTHNIQIGVAINWEINTNEDNFMPVTISGTLPNGITFSQQYPDRTGYRISGTALAGTVGTYQISFDDEENRPRNVTYTVEPGPQTIVGVDDMTVPVNAADFTLAPYSTDGNGDIINVAAVNQNLVANHQPTYTFSSSVSATATVTSPGGIVEAIAAGSTVISIDSTVTQSYEAATQKQITLTVVGAFSPTVTANGSNTPSSTAGAFSGNTTVSATLSDAWFDSNITNIQFTATLGTSGITATATPSDNGNFTFPFSDTDLNTLNPGSYDILVSSTADNCNNAVTNVNIGTLTVNAAPDTTPPALTGGTASRTSHTAATVSFTSDEAGTYYYLVQDSSEPAPNQSGVLAGTSGTMTAGANTITPTLTAGEKKIYIVGKDAAGNTSTLMTITIPAYYSGGSTYDPTPTPVPDDKVKIGDVEITYTVDKDGVVTVTPTEKQVQDIIKAAGNDPVVFDFSGIEGMTALALTVDPKWFDGTGDVMVLLADGVSLTIQDGMMGELVDRYGGLVEFRLKFGSVTVDIRQDGKAIPWYSFDYPMTVSMPSASKEAVRSVMRDANGAVVTRSWYADGNVYAKVYKAGTYDEYLAEPEFSDMDNHWGLEAVKYMASRGVVTGRGLAGDSDDVQPYFAPDALVTRAEFLTMLMRALNPEPQGAWMVQQFGDVPEGAYYYELALKAKALGIVSGTGDNMFNPNAMITRQEMFTMLHNAMEKMNMLPAAITQQWAIFDDWDDVAQYAVTPLQNLAKLGLVQGYEGNINPKGTATRAESAQVIYNLLRYDAK